MSSWDDFSQAGLIDCKGRCGEVEKGTTYRCRRGGKVTTFLSRTKLGLGLQAFMLAVLVLLAVSIVLGLFLEFSKNSRRAKAECL